MINKKKLRENILNQPPINQNTEIDKKKTLAENWFVNLRDQICNDFTKIENNIKIIITLHLPLEKYFISLFN